MEFPIERNGKVYIDTRQKPHDINRFFSLKQKKKKKKKEEIGQ